MEVGDIAVINGFLYSITQINNNEIYIRNDDNTQALLIYRNNQWSIQSSIIQDSNEQHEIHFIKGEDNPLLKLTDDQLFKLNYSHLDDNFWRLRIIQEFGLVTAKYKPGTETSQEQYFSILESFHWITGDSLNPPSDDLLLIDADLYREAWRVYQKSQVEYLNRIDWILAFLYKGKVHRRYTNLIVKLMTIDDVDIWNSIKRLIMCLLKTGDLWYLHNPNVLYWILQQEGLDDRMLSTVASYALLIQNLDIVEKLSNQGIYPNERSIVAMLPSANIDTIKWLIDKKLINNLVTEIIRVNDELMEQLYKLLYEHELLIDDAFHLIKERLKNVYRTSYMHIPTLLWLQEIGQLSEEELIEMRNIAILEDDAHVLKDMFKVGLLNANDLDYIVSIISLNQHLRKIICWLADLP